MYYHFSAWHNTIFQNRNIISSQNKIQNSKAWLKVFLYCTTSTLHSQVTAYHSLKDFLYNLHKHYVSTYVVHLRQFCNALRFILCAHSTEPQQTLQLHPCQACLSMSLTQLPAAEHHSQHTSLTGIISNLPTFV